MTYHCSQNLLLPWQPYFDKHVFPNFLIFMFFKEENNFLAIMFTFYDHFSILLLVLCTFETFLVVFCSEDVISTSYDVIMTSRVSYVKRKMFGRTIYPPIALITFGKRRAEPPPPGRTRPKKAPSE